MHSFKIVVNLVSYFNSKKEIMSVVRQKSSNDGAIT